MSFAFAGKVLTHSIYQQLPQWKHTSGIKGGAGEDADWSENRKRVLLLPALPADGELPNLAIKQPAASVSKQAPVTPRPHVNVSRCVIGISAPALGKCGQFPKKFSTSPSCLQENLSAHGAEIQLDLQGGLGLTEKLMAIRILTVDYNLK